MSGRDFVQQARAMHLGDAPERAIHGEAKLADAKALIDEACPIMPLPFIPRQNKLKRPRLAGHGRRRQRAPLSAAAEPALCDGVDIAALQPDIGQFAVAERAQLRCG